MYTPPHFGISDTAEIQAVLRSCNLAQFITTTTEGLFATALPLLLDASEGQFGTLYGHLARANSQWKMQPTHDALAIFTTVDAYITPKWYTAKAETGKVVPTWNYETVHAHGPAEFFDEPERLLEVVSRLTDLHEGRRPEPWSVSDAPADFIQGQLRGIVGIRMPITRLEGKRKMSQNRSEADRVAVADGLSESSREKDKLTARMIPITSR